MMNAQSNRWVGGLLLAGLVWAGASATDATSPRPASAHERMTVGLDQIRNQIKNGHIKLSNGVSGIADAPAGMEPGPPTPALICCSSNLRRILDARTRIDEALDELGACYDARADSEHFVAAQFVKQDLAVLGEQIGAFRAERDRGKALGALSLAGRAYLGLLESASALPPCPPVGEDRRGDEKKKR